LMAFSAGCRLNGHFHNLCYPKILPGLILPLLGGPLVGTLFSHSHHKSLDNSLGKLSPKVPISQMSQKIKKVWWCSRLVQKYPTDERFSIRLSRKLRTVALSPTESFTFLNHFSSLIVNNGRGTMLNSPSGWF
jgi:hypothetical protein